MLWENKSPGYNLQLAPNVYTSSALLASGTVFPLLETRSSFGSSFIFPSSPWVVSLNSSGSRTVAAIVPSLLRTSTPAPEGNMTVTLCGTGENTKTPVKKKGKQFCWIVQCYRYSKLHSLVQCVLTEHEWHIHSLDHIRFRLFISTLDSTWVYRKKWEFSQLIAKHTNVIAMWLYELRLLSLNLPPKH